MHRVALIYNPASGQRPERRSALIANVVAVFQGAGIEVKVIATESPESAGAQAQEAVREGCDTVIACGGDGTAHEVMQSLVGGAAALGVIPMGTANALATDLGLPASPVKAAKMLLGAVPSRVSVGRVFYRDRAGKSRDRYFVVAAGVGVDGVFFSRLDSRLKQRLGYLLYLLQALRLALTHTFPMFRASFFETGSDTPRSEEASQILAVRISNFGGLVHNLAPGAALGNDNLHVIAFKTRSRLRYLRFMVAVWFQRHTYSNTIELVDCSAVECSDLAGAKERSFVEADGELLGNLPVRIEVVPQSLTLLIPAKKSRRASL
ncbi:MAG: YegS/Rv2252/BmrU family lipid kinase [Acidobacteriaceae bacterium]|jgi:YegS/Rv2252/BmrU family lipid kinase